MNQGMYYGPMRVGSSQPKMALNKNASPPTRRRYAALRETEGLGEGRGLGAGALHPGDAGRR